MPKRVGWIGVPYEQVPAKARGAWRDENREHIARRMADRTAKKVNTVSESSNEKPQPKKAARGKTQAKAKTTKPPSLRRALSRAAKRVPSEPEPRRYDPPSLGAAEMAGRAWRAQENPPAHRRFRSPPDTRKPRSGDWVSLEQVAREAGFRTAYRTTPSGETTVDGRLIQTVQRGGVRLEYNGRLGEWRIDQVDREQAVKALREELERRRGKAVEESPDS